MSGSVSNILIISVRGEVESIECAHRNVMFSKKDKHELSCVVQSAVV